MNPLVPEQPVLSSWQEAIYTSNWNAANLVPFAVAAALRIILTRGRLGYREERA